MLLLLLFLHTKTILIHFPLSQERSNTKITLQTYSEKINYHRLALPNIFYDQRTIIIIASISLNLIHYFRGTTI